VRWPPSENARYECSVMDASVSVRTDQTAEMDELRSPRPAFVRRPLCNGFTACRLGKPNCPETRSRRSAARRVSRGRTSTSL
jgi:hypothetical protein